MTVRILDDRVINRIAAGEVVERPASVVKELVENALDAQPADLRVELEAGGKTLVRVVDDGTGMSRQDALMCIERHATSKIRSDEDLLTIDTMGFRGEALPSIAAVSRFTLVTRRAQDEEGTRLRIEGGKLLAVEACGCAPGTEITVRNLFFNVPARRRFLRTTPTEYGHCLEAVVRVALIRGGIDFSVTHNGRQTLRAPAGARPERRAGALLGPYGEALKSVAFQRGDLTVRGLVSPVGVHRQTAASGIYLYVNDRFVRDPVLRRAVMQAYKGLVPLGRYPVAVLRLELPPELVDVNVHPTKVEVRFRSPRDVSAAISEGLREGLREHGLHGPREQRRPPPPQVEPGPPPQQGLLGLRRQARLSPPPPRLAPASQLPAMPAMPDMVAELPEPAPAEPEPTPSPAGPSPPPAHAQVATQAPSFGALLPVPSFSDLRIIGQLAETYLLCEGRGELVIIDQHAAHERITLERLQRLRRQGRPPAQALLTPARISLPPARAAALRPQLELLRSIGLEIEPDGDEGYAVKAVPPALGPIDVARLVRDVADDLADEGSGRPAQDLVDRVLSSLACHGSVRAHQHLSLYEMRALLKELDQVDFSVCAHGRPVAIRVPPTELEGRFHRS